ncbi:MAG: hypothetical protein AAFW89_10485 [Bacteroidota bacterium]
MSTPKRSATQQKIEDTISEASEAIQARVEENYDALIDRLKYEKERLEREAKYEYRKARRYVRANPEQGIGVALLTGFVVGLLLGRSSK